jgi:hypothetical protein
MRASTITLIVALPVLFFGALNLHGQPVMSAGSPVTTPPASAKSAESPVGFIKSYLWEPMAKKLGESLAEKVVTGLVVGSGSLAAFTTILYTKIRRRLVGPRFALPARYISKYQRVLLLGKEGTGKTQLIRTLCGYADGIDHAPNPRFSTRERRVYTVTHELTTADLSTTFRMDIEDYRGQDPGQVVESRPPRWERLPFTAVVLMVDIFESDKFPFPLDKTDGSELPIPSVMQETPDGDRVEFHRLDWHLGMLQMLRRSLKHDFSYVCLFINKLDLLENGFQVQKINGLKTRYSGIYQMLKDAFPDIEVQVIIGSARLGWGAGRLFRNLLSEARILK